jgi:hypothetical protein
MFWNRVIQLEILAGNQYNVDLYNQRLAATYAGLNQLLDPTGQYFVKSMDPDGTLHGVLGQALHGYFESSPNHDVSLL